MESINRSPQLSEHQRRSLVIEHAETAARLAREENSSDRERLAEIENQLGLSGAEVAQIAIGIYQQSYR